MAVLVLEGKWLSLLVVNRESSGARHWVVYEAPCLSQSKAKQLELRGAEKRADKEISNNYAPHYNW